VSETITPQRADLSGMSEINCCDACNKDGCVILGAFYCAHPRKGGLHAPQMQDNEAMKRHRSAIAILERAAAEAKLKRLDEDRP
jgi:hypothetical protein